MTGEPKPAPIVPLATIEWTGLRTQRVDYEPGATIFAQGDPATSVMYVDSGAVRLSVLSHGGKEAVIAVLDAGHFFGEGCLASQTLRMATASAMGPSSVKVIDKEDMVRHLRGHPAFADRFLTHMLTRNIRIEADLVDHLFNSSEKRLARTLLLLARYGEPEISHRTLPRVSQETLAEMVGTTRSRVNFFMNKFRKLGFIEYNGGLKINNSLLSVVLRDRAQPTCGQFGDAPSSFAQPIDVTDRGPAAMARAGACDAMTTPAARESLRIIKGAARAPATTASSHGVPITPEAVKATSTKAISHTKASDL